MPYHLWTVMTPFLNEQNNIQVETEVQLTYLNEIHESAVVMAYLSPVSLMSQR